MNLKADLVTVRKKCCWQMIPLNEHLNEIIWQGEQMFQPWCQGYWNWTLKTLSTGLRDPDIGRILVLNIQTSQNIIFFFSLFGTDVRNFSTCIEFLWVFLSQTDNKCQEAKSQQVERMAVLQLILYVRIKGEDIRQAHEIHRWQIKEKAKQGNL